MAVTPRLELRQSQTLVMTPQLQQAIKLLQLSNLELATYVDQELVDNPLLERDEDDGEEVEGDALAAVDLAVGNEAQAPADDSLDIDYDNLWNSDSPVDIGGTGPGDSAFADWGTRGGSFEGPAGDLEQTLSNQESLRDHLVNQLNMEVRDPTDRLIGLQLIDMLDEAGYLSGHLEDVADTFGCTVERVEDTLHALQQFDPPGIFARHLGECLALQLRDRNRLDPAMQALLDNLDLLARRDIPALLGACGVDAEDLIDMVAEIRSLDPKPALALDHTVAQPVTPDILMRPRPGGGWIIELNNDTLPRVLVNTHYYAEVSRGMRGKEDRQYINECFQSATWLVKSLHQRANTILKVATEIVRQQDGFFANGVHHLRPLVLRDIANVIDMHESTVSRVTSNKYLATPRGIFELKYFFTPAIGSSAGGASHSAESVRHHIKALIDDETAKDVLSDDRIVDILRGEGIDIARRTVAKYREAMRIPSSVQRRRQKSSTL